MKSFGNIAKDGQVRAVASGTLPSGKPVAVNSDGTVSVIGTTVATETVGSAVVFEQANSLYIASAYDSSNNKIVVAYRDNANSKAGTAVVGTISGTSVTFGTPVVFQNSRSDYIAIAFDSSNNKIVIAYNDDGNSDYGTAIVGTVSGTSISFGTKVTFSSAATIDISSTFDSTNNKIVISYKNSSNNYGYAIVGTVSGTSISFGSAAAFASHTIYETKIAFDSSNGKVVIAYTNASQQGTAIVGTVSSTSISFGSATAFDTGEIAFIDIAYDVASGKSVIVFMKGPGGNAGAQAIVGTVSSTSISFGTAVVYDNSSGNEYNTVVYHEDAEKVIVVYMDNGDSNKGKAITGTVSGTSISFANSVDLEDGAVTYISPAYDPINKVVFVALQDADNSNYGTGIVYQPTYSSHNLTSENFIGMSSGVAVQTGSAASVGTAVQFDSNINPADVNVVYDTNSDRIVIDYRDTDNSNYHTAVVGTVNSANNSISFGTPVVYSSYLRSYGGMTFDSTNNKVVIAFRLGNESDADYRKGFGIVGTVDPSDNSISFGSATKFEDAQVEYMSAAFDSNAGKVVFAYVDNGNSAHGTAIVGTVSGTSISFGTAAVFNAGGTVHSEVVFDSTNNKVVFAYRDSGNSSYLTGIVGTVSGTSISFGSETAANNFDSREVGLGFAGSGKVVAVVRKDSDGSGHAYVGTVSGTSISFGSAVSVNGTDDINRSRVLLDESTGRVVIAYDEQQNSSKGVFVSGDVSGTSITLTSATTFEAGNVQNAIGAAYDPDGERVVLAFADTSDSNKGKVVVAQTDSIATTRAQIGNGGKAVIDSTNAISRNQIGLTAGQTYFVQTDGTLGLTAASPSVTAGTAISATELIVKG